MSSTANGSRPVGILALSPAYKQRHAFPDLFCPKGDPEDVLQNKNISGYTPVKKSVCKATLAVCVSPSNSVGVEGSAAK